MSTREEIFKDIRHESERLLDELELVLAKQEAQLKEMHIYEKQSLPETVKSQGNALIRESEALLASLSEKLAQQRQELAKHGIDINKPLTTGYPEQDARLQEDAKEAASIAHAQAQSKAKATVDVGKPALVRGATKKPHNMI